MQDALVGSTRHGEETLQVTYNGHPLHYYALDDAARDSLEYEDVRTLGQAVHDEWGGWYLVTPEGEKLEGLLPLPPAR